MYRKNVAGQNLAFCLINASTGAALTGATVTARRSIDGAAQANATGTVTELANGQYNLALSQADTNGNQIGILLTATSAIPVHFSLVTTAADPTDAAAFGITRIDAAVTSRLAPTVAGRTLDVATTGEAGLDFSNILDAGSAHTLTNITIPTVTTLTNAPADEAGVTTLLSRLTGTRAGLLDNLDAAISSRLAPTVGGRTLDVAATGEAGLDFNNINDAAGAHTLTNITVPTVTTLTNAPGDSSGTTTLLSRLSAGRATNLDNLDAAVSTRLATAGYTAPPSAASISTQVWTEPIPGAFGAGSAGAKLNSAGSAGDPWATALPGAYGAGTAGNIVGNRLDAAVSTRLATSGYTAPLDAATTKAQVTAVISTDARAEPSAVPAANASLGAKVDWMYAASRNKLTGTATATVVRNDGDTAAIGTSTDSDDGTTSVRGRFA